MAAARASLLKLSAAQLKAVAVRCGLNSSGTKAVLASRLSDEASVAQANGRKLRSQLKVLSIDLGIKNFAFCVLGSRPSIDRTPVLEVWERRDISQVEAVCVPASEASDTKRVANPKPKKTPKTSFQPAQFASVAYDLMSDLLDTHNPDAVILERQRFRTMGAAAVQEWTLRVNMLEAMLHAVIYTFKREGKWDGQVESIVPGKVGALWTDETQHPPVEVPAGAQTRTKAAKKAKMKMQKIDIVGRMLVDKDKSVMLLEKHVEMVDVYLAKWSRMKNGKVRGKSAAKAEVEVEVKKLDDLADCLLQGLAWLRWRENRQKLASARGFEQLL